MRRLSPRNIVLSLVILTGLFLLGCQAKPYPSSSPPPPPDGGPDCSYHLEPDQKITVTLDPGKDIYQDLNPYLNDEFALVRSDAFIPAWKVNGGYGGGEMDKIGTAIENGQTKDVYIGLGHCQGQSGETCLDPLPQTMVFVVQEKGVETPPFPQNEEDPGFWWNFNVYFSLKALPANPTDDDLPCWIKECSNAQQRKQGCQNDLSATDLITAFRTSANQPPDFFLKEDVRRESGVPDDVWNDLANEYRFLQPITAQPDDTWTVKVGTLSGPGRTFDVFFAQYEGRVILVPENTSEYNEYEPIQETSEEGSPGLQLESFYPLRKFRYEWFTPSCKPVIYLYPEKETTVDISLNPLGYIDKSIPQIEPTRLKVPFTKISFGGQWSGLQVKPGGEIKYQGRTHDSLYYEGKIISLRVPQAGWVVARENLASFFDKILPALGLRGKEIDDFKDYWLQRLEDGGPWFFITPLPVGEINRVEPIKINPRPATLIRMRLFFKSLATPILVIPPNLPRSPSRQGFTVVEWGGFYKG